MDVTQLVLTLIGLGGQTVKNLRLLACKFVLHQSERKSSQVHASPGQTESQVDASSHLRSLASPFGQGLNP